MTKLPPHLSLAVLLAVSLLVGWRPLVDTFALALQNSAYTHILLILPISAALILLEWRSLRPMVARNVRVGSALLAMAVLVAGVVRGWSASLPSDVQLSIEMFALVLSWIGAFVLCFGSEFRDRFFFHCVSCSAWCHFHNSYSTRSCVCCSKGLLSPRMCFSQQSGFPWLKMACCLPSQA